MIVSRRSTVCESASWTGMPRPVYGAMNSSFIHAPSGSWSKANAVCVPGECRKPQKHLLPWLCHPVGSVVIAEIQRWDQYHSRAGNGYIRNWIGDCMRQE